MSDRVAQFSRSAWNDLLLDAVFSKGEDGSDTPVRVINVTPAFIAGTVALPRSEGEVAQLAVLLNLPVTWGVGVS